MSLPTIAGVQSRIHTLPGRPPFMILREIAEVFDMEVRNLSRQFHRNIARFPAGYYFTLLPGEYVEKLTTIGQTSQGSRTDLTQYAFTEQGALFLLRFVTGEAADAAAVTIIEAFVTLRLAQADTLRRAAFKLKAAYVGRSAMKIAILEAAAAGIGFWDLWGWHDWSLLRLAQTVEEMRALGYIPQNALPVPAYVFTTARRTREMALMRSHVADGLIASPAVPDGEG